MHINMTETSAQIKSHGKTISNICSSHSKKNKIIIMSKHEFRIIGKTHYLLINDKLFLLFKYYSNYS